MSIKTIILHAGMHKTGTSSIQSSLFDERNAPLLLEKGYKYLSEWGVNHDVPTSFLFFSDCDKDFNMIQNGYRENYDQLCTGFVASIEAVIKTSSADTLIISAEGLSRFTCKDFIRLKNFFRDNFSDIHFRVVLYVRDPLSWHVSNEQTLIRLGIHIYRQGRNYFTYQQRLKPIIDSFNKESIEIYRFEDAITHGGPVSHFLGILGFEQREVDCFYITKENESLCYIVIEALNYLNKSIPIEVHRVNRNDNSFINPERNGIDIRPLEDIRGPKYDYNYMQKSELVISFKDDVLWLKKTTGIDYIYSIEHFKGRERDYDENTLTDLEAVFPKLGDRVRIILLEFLETEYSGDPKIIALTKKLRNQNLLLGAVEKELGSRKTYGVLPHKEYAQVFINTGEGFNQYQSGKYPISHNGAEIRYDVPSGAIVYDIRIDPSAGMSSVLLNQLLVNGRSDGFIITGSNCFARYGNVFIFLLPDPQLYIHCDEPIRSIFADMIVDPGIASAEGHLSEIISSYFPDYAQLFLDDGKGFKEIDSYRYRLPDDGRVTIDWTADSEYPVTDIRFDPSRASSLTTIERLLINGQADGFQIIGGNFFAHEGDIFLFLSPDPQIYIHSNNPIRSFHADMLVDQDGAAIESFAAKLFSERKSEYERMATGLNDRISALQEETVQLARDGELLSVFLHRFARRVRRKMHRK